MAPRTIFKLRAVSDSTAFSYRNFTTMSTGTGGGRSDDKVEILSKLMHKPAREAKDENLVRGVTKASELRDFASMPSLAHVHARKRYRGAAHTLGKMGWTCESTSEVISLVNGCEISDIDDAEFVKMSHASRSKFPIPEGSFSRWTEIPGMLNIWNEADTAYTFGAPNGATVLTIHPALKTWGKGWNGAYKSEVGAVIYSNDDMSPPTSQYMDKVQTMLNHQPSDDSVKAMHELAFNHSLQSGNLAPYFDILEKRMTEQFRSSRDEMDRPGWTTSINAAGTRVDAGYQPGLSA